MLECETEMEMATEPNAKINELKPCVECGNITVLFQNDICKVCLSKSFKKLVKIIDSVRK
jgi:recombinational DNA repair protein RecR